MKRGLLLINLGTPDAPDKASVRRYLREFLSDKRVIKLPALIRYSLLYGFILPFRPKKSAKAYQSIWQPQGSPLLIHSQALKQELQQSLGDSYHVVLGMRYGKPSIASALQALQTCDSITIFPLFPQYASSSTGSAIEQSLKLISQFDTIPSIQLIRDFYNHPSFIKAQAEQIKPYIDNHDFVLFSYHSVPENHLLIGNCQTLCQQTCSKQSSRFSSCYRAQCFKTSEALAKTLNLTSKQYTTSFQSRLGRTPWIQPYTDKILIELAEKGIKNLAVSCPSFVVDCLETLEEIGMRAKEDWLKLGGQTLTLIPALNNHPSWIKAIIHGLKEQALPSGNTH